MGKVRGRVDRSDDDAAHDSPQRFHTSASSVDEPEVPFDGVMPVAARSGQSWSTNGPPQWGNKRVKRSFSFFYFGVRNSGRDILAKTRK